jgi:hypothetical protein
MWAASCRSTRALQGGGGEPLTIEAHRAAPSWAAAMALARTVPATRAGAVALIDYLASLDVGDVPEGFMGELIGTLRTVLTMTT